MSEGFSLPPAARAKRSNLVDAWRAIACLSVVLFHATESSVNAPPHPLVVAVSAAGRHGWLGVPVFFVISGYCLAQAIERCSTGAAGTLAFWRDRLLRIYPVYWCAFLLACGLALVATPFNGLPVTSAFPQDPSAWVANLGLVTGWLGIKPHLTVSWSLDYEIGFYVLVGSALLLPAASPRHRLALYASITLLALAPGVADGLPALALWPQFACGLAVHAVLNPALPRSCRVASGLALAAVAVALLALHGFISAFAPLVALVFLGSLALERHLPRPPRALVAIGLASYSIYLLHIPFMSPALNLAHRLLERTGPAYAAVWLGHLALGVGAGLVFHHVIERRCERLRARLAFHSRRPASVATL